MLSSSMASDVEDVVISQVLRLLQIPSHLSDAAGARYRRCHSRRAAISRNDDLKPDVTASR